MKDSSTETRGGPDKPREWDTAKVFYKPRGDMGLIFMAIPIRRTHTDLLSRESADGAICGPHVGVGEKNSITVLLAVGARATIVDIFSGTKENGWGCLR
jgi:hypothetical protein